MLRMAYRQQGNLDSLACNSCVRLEALPNRIWELVPDEVFLDRSTAKPPAKLLYFSRAEYDSALRGLSSLEVARVIRKRLDDWSENAINDAQDFVYRLEVHCLELTAGAWQLESSPAKRGVLEAHFTDGLELMADLVGQGRYEGVSLQQGLILALRQQARILAELSGAPKDIFPEQRSGTTIQALRERTRSLTTFLQSTLRELGNSEFAESLPYVRLERVFFFEPRDPEFRQILVARGVDFFEWQNGLVASWPVDGIQELQKSGKSAEVLYMNPGDFSSDLASLTKAQLDRECAERARTGGSSARTEDHLRALRLEQHLLLRNATAISRAGAGNMIAALTSLVAEDSVALIREMVGTDGGRSDAKNLLRELMLAESELLQNAVFFREWAGRQARSELQHRFSEIDRRKLRDRERISSLVNSHKETQ